VRRGRERHDLRERSLYEGQPVAGLQLDPVAPEQQLGGARGQLGVCGPGEGGDPQPAAGVLGQHARPSRDREAHRHFVRRGPHPDLQAGGHEARDGDVEGEQGRRRVPVVEPGAEQDRVLAQREALAGRLDEGLVGDAVLVVAVHVPGPGEEVEQDAFEARAREVGDVRVAHLDPVGEQADEAVEVLRQQVDGRRLGARAARLGRRLAAVTGLAIDREAKLGGGEERMQRSFAVTEATVGQLDGVRRVIAEPVEADRHRAAGERDVVGRNGQPPSAPDDDVVGGQRADGPVEVRGDDRRVLAAVVELDREVADPLPRGPVQPPAVPVEGCVAQRTISRLRGLRSVRRR